MKPLQLVAWAGVSAIVATAALAQQPGRGPGQGPVVAQCQDDIAKFCAGKAHEGETRACLTAKKAELSAACKTALETTGPGKGMAKGQGMGQGKGMMGHGQGAGMGEGKGMMGNMGGMGSGKGMGKMGAGQGPVMAQCQDDMAKLCAGTAHGPEMRACLTAKKESVSAACKTALESTGPGMGMGMKK